MVYVGKDIYGNEAHLADAAGAAYLRARAAGCPTAITSALRTNAQQVALFTSRYEQRATGSGPYGDVRYWQGRRYVRVKGAAVAPPGSSVSRHEQGLSLDLPAGGAREWMHAHGERFGWIPWVVPTESWHFEYQHWRDASPVSNPIGGGGSVPNSPGVTPPAPIIPKEWDEMASKEEIKEALDEVLAARMPGLLKDVSSVFLVECATAGATTPSGWYIIDQGAYTKKPLGSGAKDYAIALGLRQVLGQPGSKYDNHRAI